MVGRGGAGPDAGLSNSSRVGYSSLLHADIASTNTPYRRRLFGKTHTGARLTICKSEVVDTEQVRHILHGPDMETIWKVAQV